MDNRVIPVLRIFDYAKAKEFYIDWLGFAVDWEQSFEPDSPMYIQISRNHITLHLSEHHGDGSPGAKVFVEFQNIAAYHHDLISRNYKFSKPGLEKAPWNAVCMEVIDPFGNKLLFSERQDE
jgi:catechol 2,3-dioxygenase-like lactoylglutathione lyase family enzyme